MTNLTSIEQTISRSEFAHLLAHFNAGLRAGSPLSPSGAVGGAEFGRALKKRGLTSKEWARAFRLVGDNDPVLDIQDFALNAEDRGQLFAPVSERDYGGCAIWRQADGQYRLVYPVSANDILKRAGETVDPVGAAPPTMLDVMLLPAGLGAFVAAVDFIRLVIASSIIDRRGISGLLIRQSALSEQAVEGIKGADNRALVTLMHKVLAESLPLATRDIESGARDVEDRGLLAPFSGRDGEWIPSAELIHLAYNLLSPIPAISLAASANVNGIGLIAHKLVVLRGNSMWHINLYFSPAGMLTGARIRNLDGLSSLIEIQGFLEATSLVAQTTVEELSKADVDQKRMSRTTRKDGAARPTSAAKGSQTKFCSNCGEGLRLGAKFCVKCGNKISQ